MANIIITGGFGSLGSAVVNFLAAQGHGIAIIDLAPTRQMAGAAVCIGDIDVADEDAVAGAMADILAITGSIDGLVNLSGGFLWETVEHGSPDHWDAMYRMNLRTAVVASRAVLRHLGADTAIVNVGAAAAADPAVGMAPYAASKAGIMALTKSLAEELRERLIRVNAILPTIIDTPANRRDMPDADPSRWVKPEAIAKVIAFLLSPDAAPITGAGIPLS